MRNRKIEKRKWKRIALAFLFSIFAFPFSAFAQTCPTTTVTGTIVDPNGFAYSNATITFILSPAVSSPLCNGLPIFAQGPATTQADAAGRFSLNLPQTSSITPSGETYTVQVNQAGAAQPPIGTGPQFFQVTGVTTTTSTLSLSSTLSAAAPALTNIASSGSGGANRTLSNLLAPTAINQDLNPGSASISGGSIIPFFDWNLSDSLNFTGTGPTYQGGDLGTCNQLSASGAVVVCFGDLTTGTVLISINGGAFVPMLSQSGSVTAGHLATWQAPGFLQDGGAVPTAGATLQTNGTNNSSQATLNFITSTTNAVGLTVTPSNPTGGNEKLEVTGGSYTGNAATATALAATPTQCTGSQFAQGITASGNATCATPSGGGIPTQTGVPTGTGTVGSFVAATDGVPGQTLYEYAGNFSGLPLVVNTGAGSISATGAITATMVRTIIAGDLLLACLFQDNTISNTLNASWTSILSNNSPSPAVACAFKYATSGDVGTTTQPWSSVTLSNGATVLVAEISNPPASSPIATSSSATQATGVTLTGLAAHQLILEFQGANNAAAAGLARPGTIFLGRQGSNSSTATQSYGVGIPLIPAIVGNGTITTLYLAGDGGNGSSNGSIAAIVVGIGSATTNLWIPIG